MSKAIEQKPNADGFVKPGELVEVRQSSALSLHDRRVFNLLIENAWPEIGEDKLHEIEMWRLRGPRRESGDRVAQSIRQLMTTIVSVPVKDRHGAPAMKETTLLAEVTRTIDEASEKGVVVYGFSKALREIIANSGYWGRLKATVMFAFGSKYTLALYEALCLRANLRISEQDISLADFREILGIEPGKLEKFKSLKQWVLEPVLREINGLSDFNVEIEPIRQGSLQRGKLVGFRLRWGRKTRAEWRKVLDELIRPKVGRMARLKGQVETIRGPEE
jgi:Initiator Replication protein